MKANERIKLMVINSINNQQTAHMEALQNKKLIEETLKQENSDRQQNNGNDPEESSHPCSFLWSWTSWFSQSHKSDESNLHRKIHWDQGNLFCEI